MKREDLSRFRERLLSERRRLQNNIAMLEGEGLAEPMRESIGELSLLDNHPADVASETFERSKDMALRHRAEIRLEKIDRALERIDRGTYGVCTLCGHPIRVERLEMIPEAERCGECEKKVSLPDRHPRPTEEDVIMPPFGGLSIKDREEALFSDCEFSRGPWEEQTQFDGEDTWQAVARYGTSETPQDISVNQLVDFSHMYLDADEDVGTVEEVERIAYDIDNEGRYLEAMQGVDDEMVRMPDMKEEKWFLEEGREK